MLERLSTETIEAIFDVLSIEVSFVDEADIVRYRSRIDENIFRWTPEVVDRKIQDGHPQEIVSKAYQLLSDLRAGRKNIAEFRAGFGERRIYFGYFLIKDKFGWYIGTLEITKDITDTQKDEG